MIVQRQLISHRHASASDTCDFETRFTSSDTGEIEGIAVRFNTVDTYRTEFAPSAFAAIEGRLFQYLARLLFNQRNGKPRTDQRTGETQSGRPGPDDSDIDTHANLRV